MNDPDFEALALAAAGFIDLAIDPTMLPGVAANLALLHQHASRVLGLALDDGRESAPVFVA